MRNKAKYEKQVERIKHCTDPVTAVSALADVTLEIGTDNCEDIQKLSKEVEVIKKSLFGNGNIETSFAHRVKEIERVLGEIVITVNSLNDNLVGSVGKIGRIADCERRFASLEEVKNNLNKLMWILIGVGVTQIAGAIVAAITIITRLGA